MKIRRVVAGVGLEGRATVLSDGIAPRHAEYQSLPGFALALLWATPAEPVLDGCAVVDATPHAAFQPPAGGSCLMMVTFPPDSKMMRADFDPMAFGAEAVRLMPGLAETFEPEHPGFHTTDTIDYDVVLDGEITLELDDGREVLLRHHDVAVQHGNRHAWRNKSDQPATMLFVLIGARRAA